MNACALPGGFVFVNGPLMEILPDDELAFVVGHEMAHVLRGHASARLADSVFLSLLLACGSGTGALAAAARRFVESIVRNGCSRDAELEADRDAVRLMRAAGFDAAGTERFFSTLAALESPEGAMTAWFRSHPPAAERLEQVRAAAGDTA